MALLDYIQNAMEKIVPDRPKKQRIPGELSGVGNVGAGRGAAVFEDDMIVSKPTIIFHVAQVFFNFLALACFASVASFQSKWFGSPSGLSGFSIFVAVAGIVLSLFLLLIPVIYEKYDRFNRLARALKEVRVNFILSGTATAVSLLISFIVTISAWTEPGCKNPDNDPNADKGKDFKNALGGWCNTKKAAAIFFWLAFVFWCCSLGLAILDWRSGRSSRSRDPPFIPPSENLGDDYEEVGDEESQYHMPAAQRTNSIPGDSASPFSDAHAKHYVPGGYEAPGSAGYGVPMASRPSMDAYGAFSDPPPSGFGASAPAPPVATGPTPVPPNTSGISRTMQYADPYAAVRASIAGPTSPSSHTPPSYDYAGYR